MAIATTLVALEGDSADRTSYSFALDVTPNSNELILAAYAHGSGSAVAEPTATGCGLTWVAIESTTISSIRRLTVFRAFGTVTPAVVALAAPAAEQAAELGLKITQRVVQVRGAAVRAIAPRISILARIVPSHSLVAL